VHGAHLGRRDQQAGDDAGEEERPIETVRMPPQTIMRIEGGMITASTAETGRDGDGERVVVALLALCLDEHLGLARSVGGRGAGDAAKKNESTTLIWRARPASGRPWARRGASAAR
jgi:hypothetical protein